MEMEIWDTQIHSRLVYVIWFPISVSHSIFFIDEIITRMPQGESKDDAGALS